MIISIDGFSGTGKGTLAKDLAKELDFLYVDTGAMYRAVTLFAMENKLLNNEKDIIDYLPKIEICFDKNNNTFLNNRNVEKQIRGIEVSNNVSFLAKIPEVRERLVDLQREMGNKQDIIMDGRDIGSVVFPDANIKFFLNCNPKIRAKRRLADMKNTSYEDILENIIMRDKADVERENSPLKKTSDMIEIDTSKMSKEEQKNKVLEIIKSKIV